MEDIVGSKLPTFPSQEKPSNKGYGEGGYAGSSSDTDLSNPTQSAMAKTFPKVDLDAAKHPDWQKRTVSDTSLPITFGMKAPSAGPKVPTSTTRDQANPMRKPS